MNTRTGALDKKIMGSSKTPLSGTSTAEIGGAPQAFPQSGNGVGRVPRNPGKPFKNGLPAIFSYKFSVENLPVAIANI